MKAISDLKRELTKEMNKQSFKCGFNPDDLQEVFDELDLNFLCCHHTKIDNSNKNFHAKFFLYKYFECSEELMFVIFLNAMHMKDSQYDCHFTVDTVRLQDKCYSDDLYTTLKNNIQSIKREQKLTKILNGTFKD